MVWRMGRGVCWRAARLDTAELHAPRRCALARATSARAPSRWSLSTCAGGARVREGGELSAVPAAWHRASARSRCATRARAPECVLTASPAAVNAPHAVLILRMSAWTRVGARAHGTPCRTALPTLGVKAPATRRERPLGRQAPRETRSCTDARGRRLGRSAAAPQWLLRRQATGLWGGGAECGVVGR